MDSENITKQSSKNRMYPHKWFILFLIVLLVLGLSLFFAKGMVKSQSVNSDGYQAVFLVNDQVYFGKLSQHGHWLELREVYYLAQPLQTTGANDTQQNIQLVKLGSELHGPEDVMYFGKDKVLFWENLKDDSRVVQKIKEHQAAN
jgi:hypothetical protein